MHKWLKAWNVKISLTQGFYTLMEKNMWTVISLNSQETYVYNTRNQGVQTLPYRCYKTSKLNYAFTTLTNIFLFIDRE